MLLSRVSFSTNCGYLLFFVFLFLVQVDFFQDNKIGGNVVLFIPDTFLSKQLLFRPTYFVLGESCSPCVEVGYHNDCKSMTSSRTESD